MERNTTFLGPLNLSLKLYEKGSRKKMKELISYQAFKNLGTEIMPRSDVEIEKGKKKMKRKGKPSFKFQH